VIADLGKVDKNLANRAFLDRAPSDVVAKERSKREEFSAKRERLEANLAVLGD
jgi:valyl-tRNA synthetase